MQENHRDIPGAGVAWADVVVYLEGEKANVALTADDLKLLAGYRSRAAQPAAGNAK